MRKILIVFVIVVFVLSFSACDNNTNSENSNGNSTNNSRTDSVDNIMNPNTDVEVVEKIFPNLEGIESVEYEITKLGNGTASVPGPTDYQYQGYIILTDEAAEKYASSYTWGDFDNDVTFETISERSGDFKYDPHFTKDIIKKSSYDGKVWIDGNIILFSVHTF